MLKLEREQFATVIAETEGKVLRDEEFVDHLERVSAAEDDHGDYERE